MVADDPESFADLDGHQCIFFGLGGRTCNFHAATTTTVYQNQSQNQQQSQQQQQNQNQAQEQKPEQPQGENQPNQPNQPQQPEPPKPPSWDPKKPLPGDPKDLGPDWQRDPGHRAPNDERYVNPNGDKLDWHKGIPGEKGWKGKDHWHWNEHDWHFRPGDTVQRTAILITAGAVAYWVISEASRLFPLRNLVPAP